MYLRICILSNFDWGYELFLCRRPMRTERNIEDYGKMSMMYFNTRILPY